MYWHRISENKTETIFQMVALAALKIFTKSVDMKKIEASKMPYLFRFEWLFGPALIFTFSSDLSTPRNSQSLPTNI